MFDSRAVISNQVNAVTGSIIKTYRESYFLRFHLKSSLGEKLLSEGYNKVVIQMLICGDMEVVAEVMDRKDYDKLFLK